MIYVSQGHERGIGPEIFALALEQFTTVDRQAFTFIGSVSAIAPYVPNCTRIDIKAISGEPLSTTALRLCLEHMTEKDILITLPTSKDQLLYNGQIVSGHTEYFRQYYAHPHLTMAFKAPGIDVILITEHLPLRDVAATITSDLIVKKLQTALLSYQRMGTTFDDILLAGINPHAGEHGLFGNEEEHIDRAIRELSRLYPSTRFRGPIPGDTLALEHCPTAKQLLVYMYHDQGLSFFKSRYGLLGVNVTLGLPFSRLSVDHGTAFSLYGTHTADPVGMSYVLDLALKLNRG